MSKCCSEACTKSRVVFSLGLLECLFFSGFLIGWGFISNILEKDKYFAASNCQRPSQCPNVTHTREGETVVRPSKHRGTDPGNSSVTSWHADDPSPYNDPTAVDYTTGEFSQQPDRTGYQNIGADCAPFNVNGSGSAEGNSSTGAHGHTDSTSMESCLLKQRRLLQYVQMVALLLTGLLAAPLGLFYDMYGTLKSRILTMQVKNNPCLSYNIYI